MAVGLARCQHYYALLHPLLVVVAVAAAAGGHRRLLALLPSYSFGTLHFGKDVCARLLRMRALLLLPLLWWLSYLLYFVVGVREKSKRMNE